MAILEAVVTNAGKYAEGNLASERLAFPTTTQEVQALLKRIGVDGVRYEEVFITEHDSDISGFCHCLNQYDHIDELNYLSHLLQGLSPDNLDKFRAILEYGGNDSAGDLINLVQNLDCYEFYSDIESEEDLGRYYTEDLAIPQELRNYFDYEAYGRDTSINEGGHFTHDGYVVQDAPLVEHYHGIEDIPREHRVFALPQLSIREQMAACKEVTDRLSQAAERPHLETGRGDR